MSALLVRAPGAYAVERVARPVPRAGEVLIAVEFCCICGTDLHIAAGRFVVPQLPLVLGHELAGRVVSLGAGGESLDEGAAVAVDVVIPCGACFFCRRDERALCERVREIGVHVAGGLAEYLVAPVANVHALPPGMSTRDAALVEPLACAIRGQDRIAVGLGDTVAIVGGGAQGLLHLMLARLRGAGRTIVCARHADRRARALQIGADQVVDPDGADPVAEVLGATAGRGADVVIEAAGTEASYGQAARMVRRGGRFLAYGAPPRDLGFPLPTFEIFERELAVYGSYGGTGTTLPRAIDLIGTGRVDSSSLVDAEWALVDAATALHELASDRSIVKGRIAVAAP